MVDLFAFMSTVYPHHANTNSKDCNCNCLVSCSISVLKTESHRASLFSKQRQGNEGKNLSCFLLWKSCLKKDQKKYRNQLAAKRKEVDALNREIERIVAAAMKPKSSGKKTVVDTKLDAAFANNKGKLPWPADGPVVARFGKHYHPVYKNLQLPPNNGVDIALAKGTQIRAVFDGVVKQVMVMPGYNQCVLIQHGNYFTLYCKLKSLNVAEGDKVKTSDIIGSVDAIGGQVQLHFEVWKGSSPQNPETWLKK